MYIDFKNAHYLNNIICDGIRSSISIKRNQIDLAIAFKECNPGLYRIPFGLLTKNQYIIIIIIIVAIKMLTII